MWIAVGFEGRDESGCASRLAEASLGADVEKV